MTDIQIQGLKEAKLLLRTVKNGFPIATSRAINKSSSKTKTFMRKEAVKRYRVKSKDVTSSMKLTRASRTNLNSQIRSTGKRIPLHKFRVSPKDPKFMPKGKMHKAAVFKGGSMKAIRGFTAKMPSGHIGVFERTGDYNSKGEEKIKENYGPSVPQMLGNKESLKIIEMETIRNIEENMSSETERLLRGRK